MCIVPGEGIIPVFPFPLYKRGEGKSTLGRERCGAQFDTLTHTHTYTQAYTRAHTNSTDRRASCRLRFHRNINSVGSGEGVLRNQATALERSEGGGTRTNCSGGDTHTHIIHFGGGGTHRLHRRWHTHTSHIWGMGFSHNLYFREVISNCEAIRPLSALSIAILYIFLLCHNVKVILWLWLCLLAATVIVFRFLKEHIARETTIMACYLRIFRLKTFFLYLPTLPTIYWGFHELFRFMFFGVHIRDCLAQTNNYRKL